LASKASAFDSNRGAFKDLSTVKRRQENDIKVQCENIVAVIINIRATYFPSE